MSQSPVVAEDLRTSNRPVRGKNVAVSAWALVRSLRPQQWVKNLLVFSGVIFSQQLTNWNAVQHSVIGFLLFCLASSGVYLLNDLRDLSKDRRHPVKKLRPLASGALNPGIAAMTMTILLAGSLVGAFLLQPRFAIVLTVYVLVNVGYSLGLKNAVILDVMVVAFGFVLRAVAGAFVVSVAPSPWLILCTLMLALLVGFGKRRHELALLGDEASNHRSSLQGYSLHYLDMMMSISAGAAILSYTLYTMAPTTVARVGSPDLIATVPFVLYGVFRYFFLVHQRLEGGEPSWLFVTDVPMLLTVVLWGLTACLIIYVSWARFSWSS